MRINIPVIDQILSDQDENVGSRVMIVDDNRDAAQTISWLVEMLGHDTKVVHSGEEALKLAPDFRPDFVFLDISIPDMNGYEICHVMKMMPELGGTVFVAQTGWSEKEFVDRSRSAGFDHHLVKPVGAEALETILNKKPQLY
jgi:CheY-like chemotaxis protein